MGIGLNLFNLLHLIKTTARRCLQCRAVHSFEVHEFRCATSPVGFRVPELDHQRAMVTTQLVPHLPNLATSFTVSEVKVYRQPQQSPVYWLWRTSSHHKVQKMQPVGFAQLRQPIRGMGNPAPVPFAGRRSDLPGMVRNITHLPISSKYSDRADPAPDPPGFAQVDAHPAAAIAACLQTLDVFRIEGVLPERFAQSSGMGKARVSCRRWMVRISISPLRLHFQRSGHRRHHPSPPTCQAVLCGRQSRRARH